MVVGQDPAPDSMQPTAIELAVCAEMVFLDLPFAERIRLIHGIGVRVERWVWSDMDFDSLALVEAVGRPGLRLNLDLYHAQIGEGNLIQLVERALPLVGEIQVADVPGRREPGTGEINYPAVAAALDRLGYTGVVALESWASGDPVLALERFRAAFTV
jgi:hydroxypyruvate isomerase